MDPRKSITLKTFNREMNKCTVNYPCKMRCKHVNTCTEVVANFPLCSVVWNTAISCILGDKLNTSHYRRRRNTFLSNWCILLSISGYCAFGYLGSLYLSSPKGRNARWWGHDMESARSGKCGRALQNFHITGKAILKLSEWRTGALLWCVSEVLYEQHWQVRKYNDTYLWTSHKTC